MENLFLFPRHSHSLAERRLCRKGETPTEPEAAPDAEPQQGDAQAKREAQKREGSAPADVEDGLTPEEKKRMPEGSGEGSEDANAQDEAQRAEIAALFGDVFDAADDTGRERALFAALEKANAFAGSHDAETNQWLVENLNSEFAPQLEKQKMTIVLRDGQVAMESAEKPAAQTESQFEEGTNGRALEQQMQKAMEVLNDPDATQEQKLLAFLQGLGALFEFIQRAFDGTLGDQRGKKTEKGPDGKTPEATPGAAGKTPEQQVADEAKEKAGPDATPEKAKQAVVETREEKEAKIKANEERIAKIDTEIDDDQKDLKDLKTQRADIEAAVTDAKQHGGNTEELQMELEELDGKIKAIEQSIAKQIELKQKLEAENKELAAQVDAAKKIETNIDTAIAAFNVLVETLNGLTDGLPVKIVGLTMDGVTPKIVLEGDAALFTKWGLTPDAKGRVTVGLEDLQRIAAEAAKTPEAPAGEPEDKGETPEESAEKPGPAKDAPAGEIRRDTEGNHWQKQDSGRWKSYHNPTAGMTSDSGFRNTEWSDGSMDEHSAAIVEAPAAAEQETPTEEVPPEPEAEEQEVPPAEPTPAEETPAEPEAEKPTPEAPAEPAVPEAAPETEQNEFDEMRNKLQYALSSKGDEYAMLVEKLPTNEDIDTKAGAAEEFMAMYRDLQKVANAPSQWGLIEGYGKADASGKPFIYKLEGNKLYAFAGLNANGKPTSYQSLDLGEATYTGKWDQLPIDPSSKEIGAAMEATAVSDRATPEQRQNAAMNTQMEDYLRYGKEVTRDAKGFAAASGQEGWKTAQNQELFAALKRVRGPAA